MSHGATHQVSAKWLDIGHLSGQNASMTGQQMFVLTRDAAIML